MKRWLSATFLLCALVLLVHCAADDSAPAPREVAEYSITEFMGTTNFRGASFSPTADKLLVSSDETGVFNAYAISIADGTATALTDSTTDAIYIRAYFPGDERFIYSSDQGGNEQDHLYVRELDGQITDLTPGDDLKAVWYGWAADELAFFIGTNERDPKYFDIYEVAAADYERALVFRNESGYQLADISPDERYLALRKTVTDADSDIYIYDRIQEQLSHITPHDGEVSNTPEAFHPDGSSLYFTTDESSEFQYLVRYDLQSGERSVVVEPEWDVSYAYFSKHGKYLVVAVNRDAQTEIQLYAADSMERQELPGLNSASISSVSISSDEQTLAFYMSSSSQPRDLYSYNLSGGEPVQLTHSLNERIDQQDLVDAEVVRFESFDGTLIPGILYKPHLASPEQQAPALVWVHGGPGGQSRIRYSGLLQYLINHGYVVYAINNRGSDGYGKTFYSLDDRKHGEDDLLDCVSSKQMLIDLGYVDPERIGIIGGSYGGYMVLAALTLQPDQFAAGVDLFGISNWVRTLESIPPYWEAFRKALYEELGDPAVDGERLRRISPLFHAGNISKPLLVLQGANDPRVIQVESDEIVEAARANGATVEYVVFEDEGHGLEKKENQIEGYEAILSFLDQHLKGKTATLSE